MHSLPVAMDGLASTRPARIAPIGRRFAQADPIPVGIWGLYRPSSTPSPGAGAKTGQRL